MFTARVPGIGFVEWTPAQVDDYARELAETHQPTRMSITWRGHGLAQYPASL